MKAWVFEIDFCCYIFFTISDIFSLPVLYFLCQENVWQIVFHPYRSSFFCIDYDWWVPFETELRNVKCFFFLHFDIEKIQTYFAPIVNEGIIYGDIFIFSCAGDERTNEAIWLAYFANLVNRSLWHCRQYWMFISSLAYLLQILHYANIFGLPRERVT